MAVALQASSLEETSPGLIAAAGAPTGFEIAVHDAGGWTRVVVHGELDLLTVPRLRSVLRACSEHGRSDVVVDLHALEFLDARGLSALVEGWRRLDEHDRRLTIAFPSACARRLLDLTGLSEIFAVRPTSPLVCG